MAHMKMALSTIIPKYHVGEVLVVKDFGTTEFMVTAVGFSAESLGFDYSLKSTGTCPGRVNVTIDEEYFSESPTLNSGIDRPRGSSDTTTKQRKRQHKELDDAEETATAKKARRSVIGPSRSPSSQLSYSSGPGKQRQPPFGNNLEIFRKFLTDVESDEHWQSAQAFYTPVSPVGLRIPTYAQTVKKLQELGTIRVKLENNEYQSAIEFTRDVRLFFIKCSSLKPEDNIVRENGHKLEEVFHCAWAREIRASNRRQTCNVTEKHPITNVSDIYRGPSAAAFTTLSCEGSASFKALLHRLKETSRPRNLPCMPLETSPSTVLEQDIAPLLVQRHPPADPETADNDAREGMQKQIEDHQEQAELRRPKPKMRFVSKQRKESPTQKRSEAKRSEEPTR